MNQADPNEEAAAGVTFRQILRSLPLALNLLVTFSVLLNVYLVWRVRDLSQAIVKLKGESVLQLNAPVPVIDAFDPDGRPVQITFAQGDTPTVLYVLSPSCMWCERNTQNIKALASAGRGKFRVVGISLSSDNLKEYLARQDLGFPVYANPAPDAKAALRLGGTPQTLVVSSDGRVLKNWMGAYGSDLEREIEEYFQISLPGTTESSGT